MKRDNRLIPMAKNENESQNKELVVLMKKQNHIEVGSHLYHFQITDMISQDRFIAKKGAKMGVIHGTDRKDMAVLEIGGPVLEGSESWNPDELTLWNQITKDAPNLMDDLTADVLDIILLLWMKKAKDIDDEIFFHSDDALNMRGLKGRSVNDDEYEVGHRKENRNEIMKRIAALASIRIISDPNKVEDEYQTVSYENLIEMRRGRVAYHNGVPVGIYSCEIRPARFLGEYLVGSKQVTAFFARKALEFDPYRKKYEKRLTRYLSWLWKVRLSTHGEESLKQPHKINGSRGLYQIVGLDKSDKNNSRPMRPSEIKDRLENVLDNLTEHKIIKEWYYVDGIDESKIGNHNKNWFKEYWLKKKIVIVPTDELIQLYGLDKEATNDNVLLTEPKPSNKDEVLTAIKEIDKITPDLIKQVRDSLGISIKEAASEMGISRSALSRFESNETKPMKKNLEKMRDWLITKYN